MEVSEKSQRHILVEVSPELHFVDNYIFVSLTRKRGHSEGRDRKVQSRTASGGDSKKEIRNTRTSIYILGNI